MPAMDCWIGVLACSLHYLLFDNANEAHAD